MALDVFDIAQNLKALHIHQAADFPLKPEYAR